MKKPYLLLLYILAFGSALAQSQYEPCGQVGYADYLEKQYPGFKTSVDAQFNNALNSMNNKKLPKRTFGDTIFRIPVVFHVVYENSLENLHDSLIISQIRILNEAFRRQNPDTIMTRDIFKPVAADAGIEFFLATVDPSGGTTNGITRTPTSITSFYNPSGQYPDDMKYSATGGKDIWDPGRYLNIWVCDLSNAGVDMLLGYAFPPTNAQNWNSNSYVTLERQGVVLHYKVVGANNILNKTFLSKGRAAVHEVGHYLGLRHTWGDGTSANGCFVDDGIEDTPVTRIAHSGCKYGQNSCNQGTPGDLPDQAENYMDYTNDSCMNMFTIKQASMMQYNLNMLRSGLAEKFVIPTPKAEEERTALYPNPANNHVFLQMSRPDTDNSYKVIITDLLGQKVWEGERLLKTKNEFHIGELAKGIYYFQVFDSTNKKVISQKLTIISN
jgi:hypothetical protein